MKKMRSVIELVDVIKVSDEESTLLTEAKSYEQAADQLLAMGPKLVAITLGEQGVLMVTKSTIRTPCSPNVMATSFGPMARS